MAIDSGVNIALGTDSGVLRHNEVGKEFYAMVRRGMTPLHAAAFSGSSEVALLLIAGGAKVDDCPPSAPMGSIELIA